MKVKLSFVTNSSSANFILTVETKYSIEKIKETLCDIIKSCNWQFEEKLENTYIESVIKFKWPKIKNYKSLKNYYNRMECFSAMRDHHIKQLRKDKNYYNLVTSTKNIKNVLDTEVTVKKTNNANIYNIIIFTAMYNDYSDFGILINELICRLLTNEIFDIKIVKAQVENFAS